MPRPEPAPILVVDDDPKIVALVKAYLERERFRVVTAGTGRAALRAIDVYVRRLRAKLGDDVVSPRFVATARGAGYRAAVPVQRVVSE